MVVQAFFFPYKTASKITVLYILNFTFLGKELGYAGICHLKRNGKFMGIFYLPSFSYINMDGLQIQVFTVWVLKFYL
jgi:hypothetical protein